MIMTRGILASEPGTAYISRQICSRRPLLYVLHDRFDQQPEFEGKKYHQSIMGIHVFMYMQFQFASQLSSVQTI